MILLTGAAGKTGRAVLQALLVGADEAGDRWFVNYWEQLDESEIERLFEEVFAIFRRMLEAPGKR